MSARGGAGSACAAGGAIVQTMTDPPVRPGDDDRVSSIDLSLQALILRALYDDASRGVLLTNPDGVLRHCNAAAGRLLGYEQAELIGRRFNDFTHPDDASLGLSLIRDMIRGGLSQATLEKRYVRRDGATVWVSLHITAIRDQRDVVTLFVASIEDITPRKQTELERKLAADQIIAAHREALRQLSTPLIPITDDVVALPLIGAVDGERAAQILETLLATVAARRTRVVLLDLTGLAAIDREVVGLFTRVAQATRLLGAEVILTGVGPALAREMVALDVDLAGLRTLGSLQRAVSEVLLARRS